MAYRIETREAFAVNNSPDITGNRLVGRLGQAMFRASADTLRYRQWQLTPVAISTLVNRSTSNLVWLISSPNQPTPPRYQWRPQIVVTHQLCVTCHFLFSDSALIKPVQWPI